MAARPSGEGTPADSLAPSSLRIALPFVDGSRSVAIVRSKK